MEYILVLLIVALLNGAIAYIDGLMEGIIPLTLYAEQYMSCLLYTSESSPAGLLFLFSNDFEKQKVTGHPVPERRKDDRSEHFL